MLAVADFQAAYTVPSSSTARPGLLPPKLAAWFGVAAREPAGTVVVVAGVPVGAVVVVAPMAWLRSPPSAKVSPTAETGSAKVLPPSVDTETIGWGGAELPAGWSTSDRR